MAIEVPGDIHKVEHETEGVGSPRAVALGPLVCEGYRGSPRILSPGPLFESARQCRPSQLRCHGGLFSQIRPGGSADSGSISLGFRRTTRAVKPAAANNLTRLDLSLLSKLAGRRAVAALSVHGQPWKEASHAAVAKAGSFSGPGRDPEGVSKRSAVTLFFIRGHGSQC